MIKSSRNGYTIYSVDQYSGYCIHGTSRLLVCAKCEEKGYSEDQRDAFVGLMTEVKSLLEKIGEKLDAN